LREYENEIETLALRVLVVTFEAAPMAELYVRGTGLRWPLVLDSSRSLYDAYGMSQGRWWAIWGPASWLAYGKLILRGRRVRRTSADVYQLGGDVLIDPGGAIVVHHVGDGPADRPALTDLLDPVRRAKNTKA